MNRERKSIQLNESNKLTTEVINAIENNQFIDDPERFFNSVKKSKHPLMLTFYSIEELASMQTFTLADRDIGFGLKETYEGIEIIGVHNNEPLVSNIGDYLIQAAVRNGGNCLNHFGSEKLINMYEQAGFEEVRRQAFNPMYDPEGRFEARYGQLPVIYRKLKPQKG